MNRREQQLLIAARGFKGIVEECYEWRYGGEVHSRMIHLENALEAYTSDEIDDAYVAEDWRKANRQTGFGAAIPDSKPFLCRCRGGTNQCSCHWFGTRGDCAHCTASNVNYCSKCGEHFTQCPGH